MSLYGYLGISKKAGLLLEGRTKVLRNLKRGKLLILACDLSQKEKERFKNLSRRFRIPFIEIGTKENFGKILGRSPIGVLLLTSKEIATQILKFKRELN